MQYFGDMEPSERTREAVKAVYTDACVRFYNAAKDGSQAMMGRHQRLADALEENYPSIVAEMRSKAKASVG